MGLRLVICASIICSALPAYAVPDVRISEVLTGLAAAPNVQYVLLRFSTSDISIMGYTMRHYTQDGVLVGTTALDHEAAASPQGGPILVASAEAEDFFSVMADFPLGGPQALPILAGSVCLFDPNDVVGDCFLWGRTVHPTVSPMPSTIHPFNFGGGLHPGYVARRISLSYNPSINNSRTEFILGVSPWVESSLGFVWHPVSTCGNASVEAFEQCDDGAAQNGNNGRCSSQCLLVPTAPCGSDCPGALQHSVCGNGVVEPGEACDDNNTVNLDGCSNTCQWEPFGMLYNGAQPIPFPVCGNRILESGETCDPPGVHCNDPNVTLNGNQPCTLLDQGGCGDGAVDNNEQCDPSVPSAPQACASDCTWPSSHPLATCGNGLVETGENCDDHNVADGDGCSSACRLPRLSRFVCGNTVVDPEEECDNGIDNGTLGNPCLANCTLANPPGAGTTTGTTSGGSTGTTTGATTGGSTGTTTGGTTAGSTTGGGTSSGTTTGTSGTTTGTTRQKPAGIRCTNLGTEGVVLFGTLLAIVAGSHRRRRRGGVVHTR